MHIFIGCLLSFLIAIILFFKIKIDSSISIKEFIIFLVISLFFISNILPFVDQNGVLFQEIFNNLIHINVPANLVGKIIGIMALPFTIFIVNWFHKYLYNNIILFFKKLTKVEKIYLYIILVFSIISSIVIIYFTTAFSRPQYYYDIIYTSDTGALLMNNDYMNISYAENDIRQPLFGIFAAPFGFAAKSISNLCFFLRTGYEYETILTIFQFLLLAISTILLSRLLNIEENRKKYFYGLISCSFPYLLFSLLLEQYVLCLFYLILAIYCYHNNPDRVNYTYIGAVGTLITSGIIFPYIVKNKNIKQWFKSVFKCLSAFLGVVIVGGQFPQLLTVAKDIKRLLVGGAIGLPFINKLYQYFAFVKGLFLPSPGEIVWNGYISSYRLLPINSLEWLGVLIIILCIISFILNYKNKMAKLLMFWVFFSSVILLFVGWGSLENGLVLYSLYFAWAFYSLIYLLIERVCKNRKVFNVAMILLIGVIVIANLVEFINILKFAISYYH